MWSIFWLLCQVSTKAAAKYHWPASGGATVCLVRFVWLVVFVYMIVSKTFLKVPEDTWIEQTSYHIQGGTEALSNLSGKCSCIRSLAGHLNHLRMDHLINNEARQMANANVCHSLTFNATFNGLHWPYINPTVFFSWPSLVRLLDLPNRHRSHRDAMGIVRRHFLKSFGSKALPSHGILRWYDPGGSSRGGGFLASYVHMDQVLG